MKSHIICFILANLSEVSNQSIYKKFFRLTKSKMLHLIQTSKRLVLLLPTYFLFGTLSEYWRLKVILAFEAQQATHLQQNIVT